MLATGGPVSDLQDLVMSNEQHTKEHSSPIKTPKQLAVTIVLAFIVPVVILIMLANMVTFGGKSGAGSTALTKASIDERIAPVAKFELVDATAPRVFKTGQQVFAAVCTACHTAGVAGAPKFGDKAAWAPRIATGFDALLKSAIGGKGAMPAKGGNPTLSDYEVARAVVYMANDGGANFKEPPAPPPMTVDGKPLNGASAATAPAAASAAAAPAAPTAAATAPAPVAVAAAAPAPAPAAASSEPVNPAGEKLYKSTCFACHATGVAGAPKFGDKAAWAPRIATGMGELLKVAISGRGAMPPRGGAVNSSDDDLKAAIQYMVNAAK
jgi:cytochrome c5